MTPFKFVKILQRTTSWKNLKRSRNNLMTFRRFTWMIIKQFLECTSIGLDTVWISKNTQISWINLIIGYSLLTSTSIRQENSLPLHSMLFVLLRTIRHVLLFSKIVQMQKVSWRNQNIWTLVQIQISITVSLREVAELSPLMIHASQEPFISMIRISQIKFFRRLSKE